MHIAVLGAGVIGLTTARYLCKAGHSVTVIEKTDAVANGASHANAAQLSYSFTNALANPALLRKLPAFALGRDPAIHIRGGSGASLVRWGISFLRQCTSARAQHNTLSALKLTLRSKQLTTELINELSLECGFRDAGKLVLLSTADAMKKARDSCSLKNARDCDVRVVSVDEATQIEPSIAQMDAPYAGAVYSPGDQVADPRQFCKNLSHWLDSNTDTRFLFKTTVTGIDQFRTGGIEVHSGNSALHADAVVVCTGAQSTALMAAIGIQLPVYPVRGYSVTLPVGAATPVVSLTDEARRVVLSRIGDSVRISGFADLIGFNTSRDAQRIATLLRIGQQIAPLAADFNSTERFEWGGFRPMTPTGLPVMGASKVPNVFLNTGHGMLGWTMACASGHHVAQQVDAHFRH